MKIAFLTLLFTVAITAPAWARLGETEDALVARYGPPLSEFDQKGEEGKIPMVKLTFQKNGFEIEASVAGGLSVQETFKKVNGDVLTTEEARYLLNANAQGFGWEAPQTTGEVKRWTRDDGAVAKLVGGRMFYIMTKELIDAETTAKKLEQAPSLQGL